MRADKKSSGTISLYRRESPAAVANRWTAAGGMPPKRQVVYVEQKIYASYGAAGAVNELQINGTPVVNSGKPNQIVWLPLGTGRVVINEQIRSREGSGDSLTVNALHVIIPGTIDLVISSERAEVARRDSPENLKPVG